MTIRYEKADGIATITIDNPPVNVLTPAHHKQLHDILKDFNADRDIRCGILTAAGNRAFCAGDDVKTPRPPRTSEEILERHLWPSLEAVEPEYPGWEAEIMKMERFKPIIAAVDGVTVGQGFIYMMHLCDIRYAGPNARFGMPEIAWGMGGASGAVSLGKSMPQVHAMELLLTGDLVDAHEAVRMQFVNKVIEDGAVLDHAIRQARRIAEHPAVGIRAEMESFKRSLDMSRADSLAFSGHFYRLIRASASNKTPLTSADKGDDK